MVHIHNKVNICYLFIIPYLFMALRRPSVLGRLSRSAFLSPSFWFCPSFSSYSFLCPSFPVSLSVFSGTVLRAASALLSVWLARSFLPFFLSVLFVCLLYPSFFLWDLPPCLSFAVSLSYSIFLTLSFFLSFCLSLSALVSGPSFCLSCSVFLSVFLSFFFFCLSC